MAPTVFFLFGCSCGSGCLGGEVEPRLGEVVFSGPFDGGLGADFDFDLGLRADLDKDAALEGGVKPVKPAALGPDAAAAAESSSAATRKKGFNLS